MAEVLQIEREPLADGWLEWWRLDSPQTRNALTDEVVGALRQACARARADAGLRMVVLSGNGGYFCAGGSLGGFASAIGRPLEAHEGGDPLVRSNREFGALLQDLAGLPQLLVAAVQGSVMGGGLGLVCVADLVLAASDAVFATPEVTLGIVPAQIAPFVVRRMGDGRAREWLLGGQRRSAAQAREAGLVHRLIAAADEQDWQTQLRAHIQVCAQAAPAAVAATKQLLAAAAQQPLDELLSLGAQTFAQALRGPEAGTGLKAFANKQAAPWMVQQKG